MQGGGLEGGVASGNDALKLLDNPSTRTSFINDLLEVMQKLLFSLFHTKNQGSVGLKVTHTSFSIPGGIFPEDATS